MAPNHGSSISAKIRLDGYGTKSRWGTPRVHLGANGVPLGKKIGSKTQKNYHAPKFEFSTKIRLDAYGAKSRLIDFGQNSTWRLWCQITVGNP